MPKREPTMPAALLDHHPQSVQRPTSHQSNRIQGVLEREATLGIRIAMSMLAQFGFK
jgi:hypothetical protein